MMHGSATLCLVNKKFIMHLVSINFEISQLDNLALKSEQINATKTLP